VSIDSLLPKEYYLATNNLRRVDTMELSDKDIARFLSKVDKRESTIECWEWLGSRRSKTRQYGQFSVRKEGKATSYGAHRVSYFIFNHTDPGELLVCHACDNPSCVNPHHLFLGTSLDNNRDRKEKGRGRYLSGEGIPWAKLTNTEITNIRELYTTGEYSQTDLAKIFNVTRENIREITKGVTWRAQHDGEHIHRPKELIYVGERNGNATLTPADVLSIREEYAKGGISQQKLGERYGVTQMLISKIITRKLWSHLP